MSNRVYGEAVLRLVEKFTICRAQEFFDGRWKHHVIKKTDGSVHDMFRKAVNDYGNKEEECLFVYHFDEIKIYDSPIIASDKVKDYQNWPPRHAIFDEGDN